MFSEVKAIVPADNNGWWDRTNDGDWGWFAGTPRSDVEGAVEGLQSRCPYMLYIPRVPGRRCHGTDISPYGLYLWLCERRPGEFVLAGGHGPGREEHRQLGGDRIFCEPHRNGRIDEVRRREEWQSCEEVRNAGNGFLPYDF